MKNLLVMLCFLALFTLGGCGDTNRETRSCVDVTSYDRNWNNDMKCTSSKGEQKYTSYEGARQLEAL